MIGMPYNFKKLAKSFAYTGHLNYTAPELIKDESGDALSQAADIWALGCCFFFLATKRDPFMGGNHKLDAKEIKTNIMNGAIDNHEDSGQEMNDCGFIIMQKILKICMNPNPVERPTAK